MEATAKRPILPQLWQVPTPLVVSFPGIQNVDLLL